jgi:hypothetical protein
MKPRRVVPVRLPGRLPFRVVLGGKLANLLTRIAGHKMLTIRRTVFVRGGHTPTAEGIAHEYRHVLQWRANPWGFLFAYIREQRRHGYEANRYEVAARSFSAAYAVEFGEWAKGYEL